MEATVVRLAIVQDVIARAVARFPEQRARIERGVALIALGGVEQIGPTAFAVRSQTTDGTTCIVEDGGDLTDAF